MSNLLENISKMLDCTEESVRFKLTNNSEREKVLDDIKGKALKTTYFDKNGSHQIWAYGNLRAPFNINVSAYFHARHKISLKYPFHQCVYYKNCYYPIELLELCSVNEETDSDSSINLKNKRSHASSSASEISLDTICANSTLKEKNIYRKKKDSSHRHGILWLYDTEKKLWEKHDIFLFQNK
uniref:PAZ domain-containing protein n=1 Tax=Meloidogyne javanica TaxID=6303 RepID=A0A915LUC7_MELJA